MGSEAWIGIGRGEKMKCENEMVAMNFLLGIYFLSAN